jgi:hypothetical protein
MGHYRLYLNLDDWATRTFYLVWIYKNDTSIRSYWRYKKLKQNSKWIFYVPAMNFNSSLENPYIGNVYLSLDNGITLADTG